MRDMYIHIFLKMDNFWHLIALKDNPLKFVLVHMLELLDPDYISNVNYDRNLFLKSASASFL
jgi:hypothetical protein